MYLWKEVVLNLLSWDTDLEKTWQEKQHWRLISSGNFTKHLKFYSSIEGQRHRQWLAVGDGSLATKKLCSMLWLLLLQPEVLGLSWISWTQTSSKAPWRTTLCFPQGVRTLSCTWCLQPSVWDKREPSHKQLCTTRFLLCSVTLILEMVV